MSKTNHRVNKDREEKESEAPSHKKRRASKTLLADVIEQYEDVDSLDELFGEFETYEPIRKKRK